MKVRLLAGDIHLTDLRTRMPFRYGIATMTRSPHAFVRMYVEVDGVASTGVAADLLPPKWFTKDPTRPVDDEVDEMLRVIEHAVVAATGLEADSPFDAWRALWDLQDRWGREQGLPPLLTHFGTSLVERAMIEAVCRKLGQSFHIALRENLFGIRLNEVHPQLAGQSPAELLPEQPRPQIGARHTVGLLDPLRDVDIPSEARLDDGLPQSLESCVRSYKLGLFKIKLRGDAGHDRERLSGIAAVLEECGPTVYFFTLDGNEQFQSLEEFRHYWDELGLETPVRLPVPGRVKRLIFVEQPFHRRVALDPAVGGLKDWVGRPPLIIDESDGELTSLPQALELGYAGTSHKNCKGVFKGIGNACLLAHLRQNGTQPAILSGEDLANIGPVALLQDLAVCAALGIESVERNGHHYFAGLSMFPEEVQRQILTSHPDLYHLSRDLWPTLTIDEGALTLRSVNAAPFGVAPLVNVEQFTPLAVWRSRKADGPGA